MRQRFCTSKSALTIEYGKALKWKWDGIQGVIDEFGLLLEVLVA